MLYSDVQCCIVMYSTVQCTVVQHIVADTPGAPLPHTLTTVVQKEVLLGKGGRGFYCQKNTAVKLEVFVG